MYYQERPLKPSSPMLGDSLVGNVPYSNIAPQPNSPQCQSGHPLVITATLPPQYPNGQYKCNVCMNKQYASPQYRVWHCDTCHYDLCPGCYQKGMSNQRNQMPAQPPQQIQYPQIPPYPEKMQNRQMQPMMPPQNQQIQQNQMRPVCARGHLLIKTAMLPPQYNGGFGCDKCQEFFQVSESNKCWHC